MLQGCRETRDTGHRRTGYTRAQRHEDIRDAEGQEIQCIQGNIGRGDTGAQRGRRTQATDRTGKSRSRKGLGIYVKEEEDMGIQG